MEILNELREISLHTQKTLDLVNKQISDIESKILKKIDKSNMIDKPEDLEKDKKYLWVGHLFGGSRFNHDSRVHVLKFVDYKTSSSGDYFYGIKYYVDQLDDDDSDCYFINPDIYEVSDDLEF